MASGLWEITRWETGTWAGLLGGCLSTHAHPLGSFPGQLANLSGTLQMGRWRGCWQAPRSRGIGKGHVALVSKLPLAWGDWAASILRC